MGFEAVPRDIRAAAGELKSAADGVGGADPSSLVTGVQEAMPGSQSAGAAGTLSNTWEGRFRSWTSDAEGFHQRLETSADNYDTSDQNATSRNDRVGAGTGPTP